jgi:hypothetical protein
MLKLLGITAGLMIGASTPLLAESAVHVVRGGHYTLHWEGDDAQAEEMSRLLEQAWIEFGKFFSAQPPLRRGKTLTVKFLQTRDGWRKAIADGGGTPPASGGGYYCPHSRAAYLYRQPTIYYTRALLIHETCHQFHYLSRTGNTGPRANWYVEGVVEHLAWHTWDGKSLALGQVPISLKDYPAAALTALEKGEMNLKRLVEGGHHRPMGAMLVRYLVEGEKGRLRSRYEKLAKAYDRGRASTSGFKSVLGDPAKLEPRFKSWLEKNQEPWAQVFNYWERIGPGRFEGIAKGVYSAARIKAPAAHIEAVMEIPKEGPWDGGLLLGFLDKKNYTMALVNGGKRLVVSHLEKGRWKTLASRSLPSPRQKGLLRFSASRTGKDVTLFVEGEKMGSFKLRGLTFGLAARCCTVRFRDVKWITLDENEK